MKRDLQNKVRITLLTTKLHRAERLFPDEITSYIEWSSCIGWSVLEIFTTYLATFHHPQIGTLRHICPNKKAL